MTNSVSEKTSEFKMWVTVKRLDLHDDRLTALQEVSVPMGADAHFVRQVISQSFGLSLDHVIVKIRNNRGYLVPLHSHIPVNSKDTPYVLEVVSVFQHVVPKPHIIATNFNKSMNIRLQSIVRRMERLEDLVPQIKLRHHEKIIQEIEFLSQKLIFLNKRMQVADSHCWRGMFTRSPLW